MRWNPQRYARFAAERARPFHDLVGQVPTAEPAEVVDLGCGPGAATATLCERWPEAHVHGLDSSVEMINAAAPLARPGRLDFGLGDIAQWRPEPASIDVIISNAVLQWVPEHMASLPVWAAALRPGGTLAVQTPVSRSLAAMQVFRATATSARWVDRLGAVASGVGPQSISPVRPIGEYMDALAAAGLEVNAWETTYLHVLPGEDPVLEWFRGTGLRPYLAALASDPEASDAFQVEVGQRLREEYPRRAYGTVLPFRRMFVVATRRSSTADA